LNYLTIDFQTLFKAGALLQKFTGAILVGPEIGFGDLLLQVIKLPLLGLRVKETSGRPRFVFLIV
jgi:hypothetical protein